MKSVLKNRTGVIITIALIVVTIAMTAIVTTRRAAEGGFERVPMIATSPWCNGAGQLFVSPGRGDSADVFLAAETVEQSATNNTIEPDGRRTCNAVALQVLHIERAGATHSWLPPQAWQTVGRGNDAVDGYWVRPPNLAFKEWRWKEKQVMAFGKAVRLAKPAGLVGQESTSPSGQLKCYMSADSEREVRSPLEGGFGIDYDGKVVVEVFSVADGKRVGGPYLLEQSAGRGVTLQSKWTASGQIVVVVDSSRCGIWIISLLGMTVPKQIEGNNEK